MDKEFEKAFQQLNSAQRQAVQTIDGPVLVIAGPGTGKTQLIGTRVGYILKNADVEASNILLLTFTDAAVAEMRKRLEQLVPGSAHKVNIYTYHGFANDLIRNNLEYFEGLENEPIDELAASTILNGILDRLPYSNQLKSGKYYKKQLLGLISDAKRALLEPDLVKAAANANLQFINAATKAFKAEFDKLQRISKKSSPVFEAIASGVDRLQVTGDSDKLPKNIRPLGQYFFDSLSAALEAYDGTSTKPLTAWKNDWLAKDRRGRFVPAGAVNNQRLLAFADIYQQYQDALAKARVYDYDDMVLRAVEVLEANPDFKFTQAEHYQYLMLDEFQDTNPAQLRLVQLLSDAPVHERRPNILAVGDDDQAIYAFQGADYSNMVNFARYYRGVKLITLRENYRSHQDLVDTAASVAGQIETRLHHTIEGIEKRLVAAGSGTKSSVKLDAREFASDAAQYTWVASEIVRLIKAGTPASKIAVIAPKHKYLEAVLPHLRRHKLAVAYEKRENVLEEPKVMMLEQMARLVLASAEGHEGLADNIWAEVLSYELWDVPTEEIWRIVWQGKGGTRKGQPLTPLVLGNKHTAVIGKFFLALAGQAKLASLEEMLDAMIGIGDLHKRLKLPFASPFFEHYFAGSQANDDPSAFTDLLSSLSLLRARLRNRQRRQATTTRLKDFVDFIDETRDADINILNTNPYHESSDAVNLLSAYGAKGREFKAVFVIGAQSEVWGKASRNRSQILKLPANLSYISYRGMSDDERLRLFYVAITRAMSHLYLTSYAQTLDGQKQRHLEFLGISRDAHDRLSSAILPAKYSAITQDEADHIPPETAQDYWAGRHLPAFRPKLASLLAPKLESYKLSATHLNNFIDIAGHGPQHFFIYNFLGLPQAPSTTSAFGTAMHDALAWAGSQKAKDGKLPAANSVIKHFWAKLDGGWLREQERQILRERGAAAIPVWLAKAGKDLQASDKYEKNFGNEGVILGEAKLTGKIDRLVIDPKRRIITVIDIKTGKAYHDWKSEVKTHKFRQQLMFYKLLVEGSSTFKGYIVDRGIIEFAEPDEGEIVRLEYPYNNKDLTEFKELIEAIWQKIQSLDLPDASKYPKSLKGIRQFEADLS